MTEDHNTDKPKFRVYVKPQSFSDCFIATMDPKDPFKICLYPSINSQYGSGVSNLRSPEEDLEQLLLYNYLILKRDCELEH